MMLTLVGRLEDCVLLNYRTPAKSVRQLVPAGLELTMYGPWAFWNIVACRVARIRPAGWPVWTGVTYLHVAYRLLVHARTANGRVEHGLYFIRSDADHRLISGVAARLTDFQFHHADIQLTAGTGPYRLSVRGNGDHLADAQLLADGGSAPPRAIDSCFDSVEQAAQFLKYRPLGLACDRAGSRLRFSEVFRDESQWQETPIHITTASWSLLEHLEQGEIRLELATRVVPIDYRWRLGRRERM